MAWGEGVGKREKNENKNKTEKQIVASTSGGNRSYGRKLMAKLVRVISQEFSLFFLDRKLA